MHKRKIEQAWYNFRPWKKECIVSPVLLSVQRNFFHSEDKNNNSSEHGAINRDQYALLLFSSIPPSDAQQVFCNMTAFIYVRYLPLAPAIISDFLYFPGSLCVFKLKWITWEARESKANSSIDDLNLKRGAVPTFSQVNKSWRPHRRVALRPQSNTRPFIRSFSPALQI